MLAQELNACRIAHFGYSMPQLIIATVTIDLSLTVKASSLLLEATSVITWFTQLLCDQDGGPLWGHHGHNCKQVTSRLRSSTNQQLPLRMFCWDYVIGRQLRVQVMHLPLLEGVMLV